MSNYNRDLGIVRELEAVLHSVEDARERLDRLLLTNPEDVFENDTHLLRFKFTVAEMALQADIDAKLSKLPTKPVQIELPYDYALEMELGCIHYFPKGQQSV